MVGKAERLGKHCRKTDTTSPAEKEKRSVNKSPSREINVEDDLKATILNLSKQIQELKQERLSTSFQHHRFYSNLDPLGLENELPKSYHSHSQSTKRLGSQAYTKKTKYCCTVRENIFPMREQCKSPEGEDQSTVRVTSKTGKKQQSESNDSGKRKKLRPSKDRLLISMPHKQMAIIQNLKESHSVCRA